MASPAVRIHYRRVNEPSRSVLSVTPEDYYEPEQGELRWDSVPRHDHASDYLDVALEHLGQTVLEIRDGEGQLRSKVVEMLWNGGKNRLIDKLEDGARLVIVQIQTQDDPPTSHTVRYDRSGNGLEILEHFVDVEGPGGRHETIVSETTPADE